MATIALYAGKINQMPGLIKGMKSAVKDYKSSLSSIQKKAQAVDSSVCNLSDVISSIQTSTQTQEDKITRLESFQQNSESFIADVVHTDKAVAEAVNKAKKDFYDKYNYLKPNSEKNIFELYFDMRKKVGEWCKEHWKLIVTVVIVVVAVVLICTGVGGILGAAALGALLGAGIGGLSGGLESLANGGSFWEGFENGAFSGAISGAIMGGAMAGLGQLGATLGKGVSCLSKLGKFVKATATVTKVLSTVMGSFDSLAMMDKLFGVFGGNLAGFNAKLHESTAYNVFQIGVTAVAAFTGGMSSTMSCFVAGTMILTASGLVAIENIKVGDKVISTNPDTGVTEEKAVLEVFRRTVTELVHLTVGGELIATTHDHPFYVVGQGFVNAGKLRTCDVLLGISQKERMIDNISFESTAHATIVYNFKVENYHTYFVSKLHILVHNADYNQTPKEIIAERTKDLDTREHPSKTKQISAKEKARLKAKVEDRTITKEEYKTLKWNEKMAQKRSTGVKNFWEQERLRLSNGENGTRNWTPQQKADIMNGLRPKFNGQTLQGHHAFSVSKYPHLAAYGEGIYPVTFNEHLNGWHGGNFNISIGGQPISSIFDF